ncbi:MATE family efflux transporter [soil metagenome]
MQLTKRPFSGLWKIIQYFKIAVTGQEKNFTSGNINKAIFMLSVPMILEMVMESLFAVADVFFVSKIGVNAVATVGLTESVLTIIYSIAIGLSMAATAMVARRIGEKKNKEAADAAVQSIFIVIAISCLLSFSGIFFASDILGLMGASELLIREGVGYTRLMLAGNFNIMLLFLINGIFRGAGDASLAMRSLWLANILNILLDPLFIFGLGPVPAFGVEGAAIATNIGRSVGVAYQCYFLWKGSSVIRVHKENLILKWKTTGQLIRISLGGMGQFLIGSASWIFLVRIISIFGSDALAGYTIAIRVVIFTILPSWGLSNAAATLVGQNLGAGEPERAEQSVWKAAKYNMIFLTSVSIIFFIMAESIIRLFTQELQVIYYGRLCLQYVCLGYVFYAYGMVISQAFNGAGDTKTPTIINLICFWMMQIPLAYILSVWLKLGPQGAFMAIAISESFLALISIAIFKRGKWKLVKL